MTAPAAGTPWERPIGSWASSEPIRRTMVACRNRDTRPEVALRSAVHRHGLRFRVAARPLREVRRTADMVFRSARVAVFVDGCFWHACPLHFVPPGTNTDYWDAKIARNVNRDHDTDARLHEAGWLVIRVWEHEDLHAAASRIVSIINERRARTSRTRRAKSLVADSI